MIYREKIKDIREFQRWLKKINYKLYTGGAFDEILDSTGRKCTDSLSEGSLNILTDIINSQDENHRWNEIISLNKKFYGKYGYVELELDPDAHKMSVKKRAKGRPSSLTSRDKNVTLRMSNEEIEQLDNYCATNNIKRSEAIRLALDKLLNN